MVRLSTLKKDHIMQQLDAYMARKFSVFKVTQMAAKPTGGKQFVYHHPNGMAFTSMLKAFNMVGIPKVVARKIRPFRLESTSTVRILQQKPLLLPLPVDTDHVDVSH
jgi:hypothetical protein